MGVTSSSHVSLRNYELGFFNSLDYGIFDNQTTHTIYGVGSSQTDRGKRGGTLKHENPPTNPKRLNLPPRISSN